MSVDAATHAGVVGAVVAVVMALIEVIKMQARKRRDTGKQAPLPDNTLAIELLKEQVHWLRSIDQRLATMNSDNRALALELGHLQKTADAMHTRLDKAVARSA